MAMQIVMVSDDIDYGIIKKISDSYFFYKSAYGNRHSKLSIFIDSHHMDKRCVIGIKKIPLEYVNNNMPDFFRVKTVFLNKKSEIPEIVKSTDNIDCNKCDNTEWCVVDYSVPKTLDVNGVVEFLRSINNTFSSNIISLLDSSYKDICNINDF